MSDEDDGFREYFDSMTKFCRMDFENLKIKILLFETNNQCCRLIIDELLNKVGQDLNITYEKSDTYLVSSFVDEIEQDNADLGMIQNVCENYFNDKTFLVEMNKNLYIINNFSNFAESGILYNRIFGVILDEEFKEQLTNLRDDRYEFILRDFKQYDVASNYEFFTRINDRDYILSVPLKNLNEDEEGQDPFQENQDENNEENQEDNNFDGDDNIDDLNDEFDDNQDVSEKKEKKEITAVEQILSQKKSGGRSKKLMDENQINESTEVFCSLLREAIETDKINIKLKKPALEKLKFINKIENFLANSSLQDAFLRKNGLTLLEHWIKKNFDGTYPCNNQILKMIEILTNLKVDLSQLKESNVGKYVMDLSKNFKSNKTVIKKSSDLVEKWSRMIYTNDDNYQTDNNIQYENISNESQMIGRKRFQENDSNEIKKGEKKQNFEENDDSKKEPNIYNHARIPKKGLLNFTIHPKIPTNQISTNNKSTLNINKLLKRKDINTSGKKKSDAFD